MTARGFQEVAQRDEQAEVIEHPATTAQTAAAAQAISLALKALSQRAVVALSTGFTGAGLLGGYLLWSSILQAPTVNQLVGVSLYAVFFVSLEVVRRR